MADGLVHLQRDLVRVEDDGRDGARALVRPEQRGRLLRDAGRLVHELESVHVLPAGLAARADVRARVTAHLEDAVTGGRALDPCAALDQLLLYLGSLR